MNKTDRLLAIVVELQGKGRQRAQDLAATFEVSKRTIYRDIEALSQAGVPIASAPGMGYMLMPGYFLPPLSFTTEEAIMLILGSQVMQQSFDAQYRRAADSAERKIAGVLPESLRGEVAYLQTSIRFVTHDGSGRVEYPPTLPQVRRAIIGRQTVQFTYHARFRRDSSGHTGPPRKVDPYGLVHFAGNWYLTGFDHSHRDVRNFRLDRIEELAVLEERFTRPKDWKLNEGPQESRTVRVRALMDRESARWVRESPSFFMVGEEEVPEGLLVTLTVRHDREVLQWLLGWGRHVRVLEPESLRKLLAEEAKLIEQNHQD